MQSKYKVNWQNLMDFIKINKQGRGPNKVWGFEKIEKLTKGVG